MSLNARDYHAESNYDAPDPLEAGSYPGRLVWVIGKGLQPRMAYKGAEKAPRDELYTVYELSDEFLLDEEGENILDKPRFISETFPMFSLDSDVAKSTKRYTALDPKLDVDGDWAKLIGTPCTINIVQNKSEKTGKIYNNIASISAMRPKEASKLPDLVNEPKVFDPDAPDMEVFLSLPRWLQDDIKNNLNFGGSLLERKLKENPEKVVEKEEKETKKGTKATKVVDEDEDDDWE